MLAIGGGRTYGRSVRATTLNHISIHADDLEESLVFYTSVFGMERIPSPNFRQPVAWLRLGDQELHLFLRDTPAPELHHFGLNVDDFEAVYTRAKQLGILDREAWFSDVYELPDGSVQLYVRDPAGNLIEIDWPDATTLDTSVVGEIRKLADDVPQTGDALRATLYPSPRAGARDRARRSTRPSERGRRARHNSRSIGSRLRSRGSLGYRRC